MKVNIKSKQKLNYESKMAVWFDFKSAEDYHIYPNTTCLIETWTVIEVPKGYSLNCYPRSSTYKKLWLILVNSVWIIDQDYCWENDTIKLCYMNMTDTIVDIRKGDRIWQWLFHKIEIAEFNYVKEMNSEDRGWFGSTWE